MFNLNDSMRYWLYPFPTDMRKSKRLDFRIYPNFLLIPTCPIKLLLISELLIDRLGLLFTLHPFN